MSMDVISLRIARHVGTEACFSPVDVHEGSAQVDFQSTQGPAETVRAPHEKRSIKSRAQSSVLLLNNSKSIREFGGASEHGHGTGTESRHREGDQELALLTHSESNVSGLLAHTMDINVSKIEVLRGPRLGDPSPHGLRGSRDMSQPLLRTQRTDVQKSKEARMKRLRDSHQNSPQSKGDVSTALARQGPERGRRSPVVVKAYDSAGD